MAHAGRPLRIGIDARAATEVTAGQGRVARELLRALAGRDYPHHYRCYARKAWEELEDPRLSDVDEWGRSERTRAVARALYEPIYSKWFRTEW